MLRPIIQRFQQPRFLQAVTRIGQRAMSTSHTQPPETLPKSSFSSLTPRSTFSTNELIFGKWLLRVEERVDNHEAFFWVGAMGLSITFGLGLMTLYDTKNLEKKLVLKTETEKKEQKAMLVCELLKEFNDPKILNNMFEVVSASKYSKDWVRNMRVAKYFKRTGDDGNNKGLDQALNVDFYNNQILALYEKVLVLYENGIVNIQDCKTIIDRGRLASFIDASARLAIAPAQYEEMEAGYTEPKIYGKLRFLLVELESERN